LPLVIFPGGSANVLAKELGIPTDLAEACALMSRGPLKTKTIDVGRYGKRYFLIGISLGFEADVVKGASRESKNKSGIFAYLFSAVAALKITKKAVYRLTIDGRRRDVEGLSCMINNTGNIRFSNISFDKHIDVSDGFLDVVVVRKANLGLLRLILTTLIKKERPDNVELVEHWQGRDISISASPKQAVQCDGEIVKYAPLRITIVPGAIQVLVPGCSADSGFI
jgi:diacylglycerol kinase (ATP)